MEISDYESKWYALIYDIAENLKPGERILEAGCGSGRAITHLSSRAHAVGLDISDQSLHRIRNATLNNKPDLVKADVRQMPFRSESFGFIFNSGVIEHFDENDDKSTVEEMLRVIRSGGKMALAVPNSLCLWYQIGKWILRQIGKWNYGYERAYSPGELKQLVEEIVVLVRLVGLQFFPPAFDGMKTYYPRTIHNQILNKVECFIPEILTRTFGYAIVAIGDKK